MPIVDSRRALLARSAAASRSDWSRTGTSRTAASTSRSSGTPAPIPAGPALLAVETGRPIYVGSVRRHRAGRYRARLFPVPTPGTGTRREKIVGLTRRSRVAFESLLGRGPEQWWGAFHPIWPDLDQSAPTPERRRADPAGAEAA